MVFQGRFEKRKCWLITTIVSLALLLSFCFKVFAAVYLFESSSSSEGSSKPPVKKVLICTGGTFTYTVPPEVGPSYVHARVKGGNYKECTRRDEYTRECLEETYSEGGYSEGIFQVNTGDVIEVYAGWSATVKKNGVTILHSGEGSRDVPGCGGVLSATTLRQCGFRSVTYLRGGYKSYTHVRTGDVVRPIVPLYDPSYYQPILQLTNEEATQRWRGPRVDLIFY